MHERRQGMNENVMTNLVGIKYAKYEMYVDLDGESPEAILAFLEERARTLDDRGAAPTLFLSDFCFDPHIAVTTNNIVRNNAVVYHNHDFVELNYVLRGTVTEYVNHVPVVLKENELLFMTPGVYHSCYPCAGAKGFNIILRKEWLDRFQTELREHRAEHFLNRMDKKNGWFIFNTLSGNVPEYIAALLKCNPSVAMEALEKEALAKLILLGLNACRPQENATSTSQERRKTVNAEEILNYIAQNFATATLSDTAAHFGYTPEHLHRIIKKQTGNGFSVFQLSARMSKAVYLLSETSIPIHRIACMLGLSGSEYFCRLFKKYTGFSPRAYRKKSQSTDYLPKNTPVIQTENNVQNISVKKAAGNA